MNRWLSTEMLQCTIKTLRATQKPRQSALGRLPSRDEGRLQRITLQCPDRRLSSDHALAIQTVSARSARSARQTLLEFISGGAWHRSRFRRAPCHCDPLRGESMRNKPALLACMVFVVGRNRARCGAYRRRQIPCNSRKRAGQGTRIPRQSRRRDTAGSPSCLVLYALAPFRRSDRLARREGPGA